MEVITIPHIHITSIDIGGICLPGIGVPDGGKKGLVWPAGLKESIKAIYDPAKQGMTNYDVIESYATNFKYWSKTTGITHVNEYTMSFIDVPIKGYVLRVDDFVPFSILVSGLTNGEIIATTYTNNNGEYITITITKNGVYSYPVDSTRIIFNCITAIQNATITQLPTSVLKDLSGNGNHAYLYGGKGRLNSGMGIYNYVFNNGGNVQDSILNKKYTVYINDTPVNGNLKFKVVTLNPNTIDFSFEIVEKDVDGKVLSYNGMKTPTDIVDFKPRDNTATIQLRIRYDSFATTGDIQLGIQLLPNAYPHQLCYDGKMYAVCYGFPILEDYTVMADRTWFSFPNNDTVCLASKAVTIGNGAFIFELFQTVSKATNFGLATNVEFVDNEMTYQTKSRYNSSNINTGIGKDEDILYIGRVRDSISTGYVGCHGQIIIADRSFPIEWINWLKDNWKKI